MTLNAINEIKQNRKSKILNPPLIYKNFVRLFLPRSCFNPYYNLLINSHACTQEVLDSSYIQ
jgi:hypothetical protein